MVLSLADPLIKSKLQFFASVAKDIEPFLARYQTDQPMIPFLAKDLNKLVVDLMRRIIKEEVLVQYKGVEHLLNLKDESIFLDPSKVDIGFEARGSSVTKKATDRQRYSFRHSCFLFIKAIVVKVLGKCPVKSALVRSLDWLNPQTIITTDAKERCDAEQMLLKTLDIMSSHKRIKPSDCDIVKKEFRKFCDSVLASSHSDKKKFNMFNKNDAQHRVDTLYSEYMAPKFPALWSIVQQLLLLSHGQASVERGFSVHKQTTVENISKKGLKARRLVIQAVRDAGGAEHIDISKEMLSYCSQVRNKYKKYREEQRKAEAVDRVSRKRKADNEELAGIEKKKQRLMEESTTLQDSADRLAEEAAEKKNMALLLESNALRKRSKELSVEAEQLKKEISVKKKAMQ
jgi:hypothetical protein